MIAAFVHVPPPHAPSRLPFLGRRADARRQRERRAAHADLERLRADERADLELAAARTLASGRGAVVLGRGAVRSRIVVTGDADAAGRALEGAPLVVPGSDRILVRGPTSLAESVARGFRQQPGAGRQVLVNPPSGRLGLRDAEVWIGPFGDCFARTPSQAGGAWVPVDVILSSGVS